jgi:hypothetical protein
MRHFLFAGIQIRVGVIRGQFCYQPFVAGRLTRAVALFADLGSIEANQAFFEAHFEPVVKQNGDIIVLPKGDSL